MGRKKKVKKIQQVKKRGRKRTKKTGEKKVEGKKLVAQNTLKTDDEKIQIKKIKKQPTEKKIYNIKDYVVYPKHGVGKIVSIEKAKMGDIDITFYKVLIEKESNQIVAFTREIKKKSMEFRLKIIEILWKIVYSDGSSVSYESNLIRRVSGLLYVSDRDSGMIKLKVKNSLE